MNRTRKFPQEEWKVARALHCCEYCNRVIRKGQVFFQPYGTAVFCTRVCYEVWEEEQKLSLYVRGEDRRPFPAAE